ncbi:MAG: hypothetical protein CL819_10295 [Croceicoccus sp.]|nr:hypothetical protein [Croceicoccus sp.]|tara:strand:+ start:1422 stop:2555 length:1134 start_codon:yes stop_codon:yes gene_type:complete
MKRFSARMACALITLACANSALADDTIAPDTATMEGEAPPILVEPTLMHPSASLMNDHMHDGGEFMVGLRWMRENYGGANQSGTDRLTDAEVLAAGYAVRASDMTMDMVMLDLMYAPSDDVTLMVMPMWMRHRMTMLGIDPMEGMDHGMGDMDDMNGMGGHGGHSIGFGDTMTHSVEGFSDTLVSASYRLARTGGFNAHATLGVWVPTGSVSKRNGDGSFVHYGMQPGSGTWDIEPSVTVSAQDGLFGWGAQASYKWRAEDENRSGFASGDVALATGWASYALTPSVGAVARLGWEHEGAIEGHYNAAHGHSSPADIQGNYGGDTVRLGLGVNALLPFGSAKRPQLSAEAAFPLYQDLNGIQLPEDWRLALSLSQTF